MPYGENDPTGPEKVLDAAPSASIESFSPGLLDGFGESLYKAPLMVGARAALVAGETFTPPLREAAEDLGLGKPVDDWLVEQRDITRKAMLDLQPKPGATGWVANNLMYGVGVPMAELLAVGVPTAIVTGSPQAGIATAAGYEGLATFHANRIALEAQGVDHDTATKLAGVQGGVAGAMALIPGTLMGKAGASVAENIARVGTAQAAVNVSAGAAQRAFTADFLQSHGYPEMAAQVHPFAIAELATDAALGFALGAYGGVHASRSLDAAMYANSAGHGSFDTMRGAPVDINAINAHADAMAKATDDLLNGRPVDVPREGEYIPAERPESPATRTGATIEGEQTQPALPAPTRRIGYEPVPEVDAARAEYLDHVNAELDAASREIAAATSTESAPAFSVEHMRAELGWAERGGHLIRTNGMEGDVVGKTAWIPHSDFWPNRPDKRLTEKQAHEVLDKAAGGAKLKPIEQRFLDYARQVARERSSEIAAGDREAEAERAAIRAEYEPEDLAAAHYADLPAPEQVEFDRWVAYAHDLHGLDSILDTGEGAFPQGNETPRAGGTEASARGDQVGESLASYTRSQGGDQQGQGLETNERRRKDTYTHDLFGERLPTVPRGAQPARGNAPAASPSALRRPQEIAPGIYASVTTLRQTGTLRLGVERIASVDDAAHAFAYLRKYPTENLVVLTTDANGTPLRVVRHAVGSRNSAPMEASAVVGAALRDPRARAVWVAHNHPSGAPVLSEPDISIAGGLHRLFANSPVQYKGFFAIARGSYAFHDGARVMKDLQPIVAAPRKYSVPIEERFYAKQNRLGRQIRSWDSVIDAASVLSRGQEGIMLLNLQNEPTAFVDLDPRQMTDFATHQKLMQAFEASNAWSMVPVVHGGVDDISPDMLMTMRRYGRNAGVWVLDAVALKKGTGETAVQRGKMIAPTAEDRQANVLREDADKEPAALAPYSNDEIVQREAEQQAKSRRDALAKKAADEKAIADAQRDAFALTGSDRLADLPGQQALFEPAREYRLSRNRKANLVQWFGASKVVDEGGNPLRVYHGTARPDRVSTKFSRARATSGPMAFFTDDPAVASSYATGKQDTSMTGDELLYAEWFRYTPPGAKSAVAIDRAWHHLDPQTRATIAERAPTLHTDDNGNVVSTPDNKTGNGSYDYNLAQSRGNALKALVEDWLNSGMLFDQEEKFITVLREAGFPVKGLDYIDQQSAMSAVYPVYLKIEHPLDTAAIPANVHSALDAAARRQRKRPTQHGTDIWDKNMRDAGEWMNALERDSVDGTTHAWTSIPDWVTKTLRGLGYDGIQDTGGKYGGNKHSVWIPFSERQVKSATGNRGTFDESSNILREPDEPGYSVFPGTPDDPMPSASHLAAADARVAEAEKSADKATAAAVECAKVEEQNA